MSIDRELGWPDANKLCRTCLQQSAHLHSLFVKTEQFPQLSLADILFDVAKIDTKMAVENIIPSHMCGTCSRKLKNAYAFVLKAQETHKRLLNYVEPIASRQPDCLSETPIDIPLQNASDFLQIKMEAEYPDEVCEGFTALLGSGSGNTKKMENINGETNEIINKSKTVKQDSDDEEMPLATIKRKTRNSKTLSRRIADSDDNSLTILTKQEPDASILTKNSDNLEKENTLVDPITVPIGKHINNSDIESFSGFLEDEDSNSSSSVSEYNYLNKKWKTRQKVKRKKLRTGRITKANSSVCDICGQRFAWKKDLKRHHRIHDPNRKEFECSYCSKKFLRKDKLKNHIKIHLRNISENHKIRKKTHPEWNFAEKLFSSASFQIIECKLCLKRFANTKYLREHIPQHSDPNSINVETNAVIKELYPSSQAKDVVNLICDDIQENRWAKFYSIVNGHGYEMCLSDSDDNVNSSHHNYTCEMCSEVFDRKFKVFDHIKEKHSSGVLPHKCPVCRVEFVCKDMFEIHLHTQCKNRAKKFKCVKCPGKFMWIENLDNHECSYRYGNKQDGEDSLKSPKKQNKNATKCDVCDKTFLFPQHLKNHKEKHINTDNLLKTNVCLNRKIKIECKLCNKDFEKLSELRQHIYSHIDGITGVSLKNSPFIDIFYPNAEKSQIPQLISADFAAKNISKFYSALDESGNELYISDSETESEEQTNVEKHLYKCELCNKEFHRKKLILLHQDSEHENSTMPHACTLCEKNFSCTELLQYHLKSDCYNADKKWHCSKCKSKFVWQANLQYHLNLKHPELENEINHKMGNKLQCDECDKTFIWPKDLSRHKRCHLPDDEKFECPLCDRKFNRKDNMQSHMKVHGNSNSLAGIKISAKNKLKVVELDERLCKPNGCKIIQCKICLSKHMKISDLKTHLLEHKDNINFSNRKDEISDISFFLYPEEASMDIKRLIDRITNDIAENRFDKFYSITNEFGYEMELNSSETESDSDMEEYIVRNKYTCDLCLESFDRKYKLFDHQNRVHPWSDVPHSCHVCEARFVSLELLNIHLKSQCENMRKPFACKRCTLKFMWKENLKNHIRTMHAEEEEPKKRPISERKFCCKECGKSFIWQKDLTRHMTIHTPGGGIYKCSWCPRKFYRKDNLHVHLKRHGLTAEMLAAVDSYIRSTNGPNGLKVIACKACNHHFATISLLRDHLSQYPYSSCIATTPRNESALQLKAEVMPYNATGNYSITNALGFELELDDSETDHEQDLKKYTCEICNTEFARKYEIAQHQRNSHQYDEMPKKCSKCNFKTVSEIILTHHLRTQCANEEKKFKCDICSFKFMWKENLENHKKIIHVNEQFAVSKGLKHEKDKTFECLTCNRKYNRKDRLTAHLKKHDKSSGPAANDGSPGTEKEKKILPKKFLCAHCGRAVSSSSNLIIHMRRHTGEKPFKCEYCNKGFPRSSDLACHRRTHTGEKPHKCTVCDKAFSRSYKLQTHMRIHSGERPYKCTYCEKSFAQSNDLTLHVRRHTGERPYVCGICGERFIQGTALKNHRQMRGHFEEVGRNVSSLLLRDY